MLLGGERVSTILLPSVGNVVMSVFVQEILAQHKAGPFQNFVHSSVAGGSDVVDPAQNVEGVAFLKEYRVRCNDVTEIE